MPFWGEPGADAKIISERKYMFTQQLQRSFRLSAGCKGWGAGARLAMCSALERSPIPDAWKLYTALLLWAAQCSLTAQAAGSPDVQEERHYKRGARLYSDSPSKGKIAQPCYWRVVVGLSTWLTWHFCSNFNGECILFPLFFSLNYDPFLWSASWLIDFFFFFLFILDPGYFHCELSFLLQTMLC